MHGSNLEIGNIVLSRRNDESIHIGDDITVTVVRIGRGQVRLRVSAPKSVNIRRGELPVIELGAKSSRIANAYGCHLCGDSECVDKKCRE